MASRYDEVWVVDPEQQMLVEGGRIAIIGYMHIWSGSEQLKRIVCEVWDRYRDRVWSTEEVLGYLYSISVHSKRVLR